MNIKYFFLSVLETGKSKSKASANSFCLSESHLSWSSPARQGQESLKGMNLMSKSPPP